MQPLFRPSRAKLFACVAYMGTGSFLISNFWQDFLASGVSFPGRIPYVIQLFTILMRGLLKTMAKQPSASHSEKRRGTVPSAAQDKKKRLADALRRNLAKRKTDRRQNPGNEPNAG